ncbi:MAG: hypothetical protein LBU45_06145 [Azoarcus sp.]|jgi:hypothetical protein|nr:hypothetical protein [Azoarcus sp.]
MERAEHCFSTVGGKRIEPVRYPAGIMRRGDDEISPHGASGERQHAELAEKTRARVIEFCATLLFCEKGTTTPEVAAIHSVGGSGFCASA